MRRLRIVSYLISGFLIVFGCADYKRGAHQPLKNAKVGSKGPPNKNWRLEVTKLHGSDDPILQVALVNISKQTRPAYYPNEYVTLELDPDPPLVIAGHGVAALAPVTDVEPGGRIPGRFDIRDRLRLATTKDGSYICRMLYDDMGLESHLGGELKRKPSVGRVVSPIFRLFILGSRVVAVEID